MIVVAFLGLALSLQVAQQTSIRTDGNGSASRTVPAPTDSTATALRVTEPPVIDGKGDDQDNAQIDLHLAVPLAYDDAA